jgi:hypothetical protein
MEDTSRMFAGKEWRGMGCTGTLPDENHGELESQPTKLIPFNRGLVQDEQDGEGSSGRKTAHLRNRYCALVQCAAPR